jgi:hypothetical protein
MSNTLRFWSSLRILTPIFQSSVQFTLEKGNAIQFRLDDWLQGSLDKRFPNLYCCVRFRDALLADQHQGGIWKFSFYDT